MPSCDKCRHYRLALPENAPAVSLSLLLDSGEPPVYEEMKRIAAEEYDHQKSEEDRFVSCREDAIRVLDSEDYEFLKPPKFTRKQIETFNRDVKSRISQTFNRQPLAVTHCAVHASRGRYYVAEIRNWANTCKDFKNRPRQPICAACAHYQPTTTEMDQQAEASTLIRMIGVSNSEASSGLQARAAEIQRGIAPGKAHNLQIAAASQGRLQRRLPYLPYCEAPCPECAKQTFPATDCSICRGTGVQRAQPEFFNQLLGCQAFQPNGPAAAATPAWAAPAPALQTDSQKPPPEPVPATPEPRITAVTERGLSPFQKPVPPTTGSSITQTLASHAVGFLFDKIKEFRATHTSAAPTIPVGVLDAQEIPEGSIQILVPGSPPLTTEMLRRSVAMLAALTDEALQPGAESQYAQFVGSIWRGNQPALKQQQLLLIRMYDLDRTDPAVRAAAAELLRAMAATAGGSRRTKAPPATAATVASPVTAQTAALEKVCKDGHRNPPGRIFCAMCGKPLDGGGT